VYAPIHGTYSLIMWLGGGKAFLDVLKRFALNMLYSGCFLAAYCDMAWIVLCMVVRARRRCECLSALLVVIASFAAM
jgi:hypothetical protein